jgi:SAM-dependent methyltransferase
MTDAAESEAGMPRADNLRPSRAVRSRSFASIAEQYDRSRPGPSPEVLDWLLPFEADVVVDLGAGTGALTRLLVERVPTVVAVEPDGRMRAVLAERVPRATVLEGAGESIPLDDGVADGVFASSSWHWMDPAIAVPEVARVLRPGGSFGVVWSGPDWTSQWLRAIRPRAIVERLMAAGALAPDGVVAPAGALAPDGVVAPDAVPTHDPAQAIGNATAESITPLGAASPHRHELVIPEGSPFEALDRTEIRWVLPMTADDLVGLLGTFSGVITLDASLRAGLLEQAEHLLADELGLEGAATTDVPYLARCWRARRTAA